MADLLTLSSNGASRSELRRTVDVLQSGGLVGLPDETGYVVCGSPLQGDAFAQLAAIAPPGRITLQLCDPELAEDYSPPAHWAGPAQRLARRCWPGPLILETPIQQRTTSLDDWPSAVQAALTHEGRLRLACSAQAFLRDVGRELPWPLLTAASSRERPEERFGGAIELQQRCGTRVELIADAGAPRYQDRSTVVRLVDQRWELQEEGIVGRRTVAQLASRIVLFVCTGNTCRSPMAEVMFRKLLADRLDCREDDLADRGWVVLSAGLATTPGMSASGAAVELMHDEGLDLSGHQSQTATPELLAVADHIVTMTRSHRDSILTRFPELGDRVQVLAASGLDVSDPFGGELREYERCRDEIRAHLRTLLTRLAP